MPLPFPASEQELSEWPWEDFEEFALSALRRYYGIHEVMLEDKRSRGESGRDGDSVYVIAEGQSDVRYKLWVEIKKRTGANLDVDDVSGHVLLAFVADVNQLVFVANCSYTDALRSALGEFAFRCRVDFTLMTCGELLDVARRTGGAREPRTRSAGTEPDADPPAALAGPPSSKTSEPLVVEVRAWFSTRIDRPQAGLEAHDLMVPPGTPLFLVVDTAVVQCCGRQKVEFSTTAHAEGLEIAAQLRRPAGLMGLGDRFRAVHTVFVQRPGEYSAEDFLFNAVPDPGAPEVQVRVVSGGRLRVLPSLLADWLPPSRSAAEEGAFRALGRFLAGRAPMESIGVIAAAGTGKTHLVQRLRHQWIDHGVHEVLLDGSQENRDQELAVSLLRSLVPIQPDTFRVDGDAVRAMLVRLGLPEALARSGAALLAPLETGSELRTSVRELGQLLALVLAIRSERQPVAVILEDLHKAYASALALLHELLGALRGLGKGRVVVVFTSRDVSSEGDPGLAGIWESHIRELCGEQTSVVTLAALEPAEAIHLLRASVPTLEAHQAAAVIAQVGRTPFALREALALLRDRDDLVFDARLREHVLVRPEAVQESIDSRDFRDPTRHRLEILRHRLPLSAWSLLEAAACLGKFFDMETASAPSGAGADEAYAAIEAYQRLEILTARGLSPRQAAFDHDLIRRVVLEQMGPVRQRRVAGELYARAVREGAGPGLAASLAYQAGLAAEAYEHARALAGEAGRRGRPADAASALGLAITVVDDNVAQRVIDLSPRTRGALDDAVAVAAPCTLAEWSTSKRQQELLALLMEYIGFLSAVIGSGSQVLAEALTEAEMLAAVRGDLFRRAQLVAYRGRQDFNKDRFEASVRWHREADEMLQRVPDAPVVRAERAENLIRMAIGLRQLAMRDESRTVLRQALRLRAAAGWPLLLRVLSNWGATYFQDDWARVRHFWERAERVAALRDRPERLVHTLIDVAHLDLLEDRHDAAHERLLRAEAIAEDRGYDNSLLRVHLNLGCLHLVRGEYAAACHHLLTAEQMGVANRIPRRLWRARANLATLYEAIGEPAKAYVWDSAMLSTFELLPDPAGMTARDREASLSNTRKVLALANLFLRADDSSAHAALVDSLGEVAGRVGAEIAGAIRQGRTGLPGLRDRHCKQIGSRRRFIITE